MIKFLFENILTIIDNFTQHKNLSYIKEIIGSDLDIFFDIGCHKGETIDLVNKTFKVKKIFAFDADKDCISGINHKKLSNVHFYSNAVGNFDGKKTLFKYTFSAINSLKKINNNSIYYKKKEKILNFVYREKNIKELKIVEIIKLDTFIKKKKIRKIDILKIDTEGSEYDVLKGLRREIQKVQIILFEHHFDNSLIKGYKFSDINNFLIKNGFVKSFKSKMIFRKIMEYIYIKETR